MPETPGADALRFAVLAVVAVVVLFAWVVVPYVQGQDRARTYTDCVAATGDREGCR